MFRNFYFIFFIVMCNVICYFNKVIVIKLYNFVNIRNNIIICIFFENVLLYKYIMNNFIY